MARSSPANALGALLTFLQRLEETKIWYELAHVRDSVMVQITVPGERWEIEFFEDGHIEAERFISSGILEGADILDDLISKYGD